MKAAIPVKYGQLNVLSIREVEPPTSKDKKILLKD
jgi:hypothetical protein